MNWRDQSEFVYGKHWEWLAKPLPELKPVDALDRIAQELLLHRILTHFFVDFFQPGEAGSREYPKFGPSEIKDQKPWEFSIEAIGMEEYYSALDSYDFRALSSYVRDSPSTLDTISLEQFSILLQPVPANYLVTIANFPLREGEAVEPFDSDEEIARVRSVMQTLGADDSETYRGRQDSSTHQAERAILLVDPRAWGEDEIQFQRAVEVSVLKGQGTILSLGDLPAFFILDEAERKEKISCWPDLRERIIRSVTGKMDRRPDISVPLECRRLFLEAENHFRDHRLQAMMMLLGKSCELARHFQFPNSVTDRKLHWEEISIKHGPLVKHALLKVRDLRNKAAHIAGSTFTPVEAADALNAAQLGLRNLLARKGDSR